MTSRDASDKPNLIDQVERRPTLGRFMTVLGLLVSVVGVTVSVWFGVTRVQRKRLESVAIAHISLVDVKDELRGKLTVLYSGHEVPNISKYSFVVRNAGNEPMRPEDFVEMPRFEFTKDMGVMDCRIVDRSPPDLGCRLSFDTLAGQCVLNFDLLNPDDQVTVDVLYTGQAVQTPKLTGRIAGVRTIANLSRIQGERKASSSRMLLLNVLATLFALFVLLVGVVMTGMNWDGWRTYRKQVAGIQRLLTKMADAPGVQVVKMLSDRDMRDLVGDKALEVLIGKPKPRAGDDQRIPPSDEYLMARMSVGAALHFASAAYREWYRSPFKPDLSESDMERAIELIREHTKLKVLALRKSMIGAVAWAIAGLVATAGAGALTYFVWF